MNGILTLEGQKLGRLASKKEANKMILHMLYVMSDLPHFATKMTNWLKEWTH